MATRASRRDRLTLEHKIEIIATVLLALATICSAWSVYEARRWTGEQFAEQGKSLSYRTEAQDQLDRALYQEQIDIGLFTRWADAVSKNDTQLADFLRERFRPEFVPAFEAWLNQTPEGVVPLGTPFDLPEYQLATNEEGQRLLDQAANASLASQRASQNGDNYIFVTIIFAMTLFLAGIQSKLGYPRLRLWLVIIAAGVFLIGVAALLSFPINVGF